MQWEKPSVELIDILEKAIGPYPCQRRPMFGCPAFFINGHMFTGVHQHSLFVRLSEEDRRALAAESGCEVAFEPMPGRIMKDYAVLPESVHGEPARLARWLDRSYAHVSSLPPKEGKGEAKKSGARKGR